MKTAIGISFGLLGIAGLIIWYVYQEDPLHQQSSEYQVIEQWALPKTLEEISALSYLGGNQLAMVQDEKGSIFIYNLAESAITHEIAFGEAGDYEGIEVIENDAYVLRSDGVLFRVKNFREDPQVASFETSLHEIPKVDVEGLGLNSQRNGLLVAAKHNSQESQEYKIILELLFNGNGLVQNDLMHLDMNDPAFASVDEDLEDKFSPSSIAIHPVTEDWYLLDAKNSLLLITNNTLKPKRILELDEGLFPQPEGLAFAENDELYVSTEGDGKPGKIVKLKLNAYVDKSGKQRTTPL